MTKLRPLVNGVAAVVALGSALVSGVAAADTVKIAFIDPLSGLMAPVGQNQLKSWQYVADVANQKNWAGAHKFEVVGFDNKLSPQESLTILKQAVDQNIRYIVQGNGSSVGLALEDAVAKALASGAVWSDPLVQRARRDTVRLHTPNTSPPLRIF